MMAELCTRIPPVMARMGVVCCFWRKAVVQNPVRVSPMMKIVKMAPLGPSVLMVAAHMGAALAVNVWSVRLLWWGFRM
jgi:hypothetical protein